jgi:hypothetical protein
MERPDPCAPRTGGDSILLVNAVIEREELVEKHVPCIGNVGNPFRLMAAIQNCTLAHHRTMPEQAA